VTLLLVCLAGAAGTGVRYLLGGWVSRTLGADFPYGTLVVNVVGSFLIGVIQPLAIPETARVTLAVGAMGGFTTYSAFSYETVRLLERGAWPQATANVVLTTVLCLVVCALGLAVGRALAARGGGLL